MLENIYLLFKMSSSLSDSRTFTRNFFSASLSVLTWATHIPEHSTYFSHLAWMWRYKFLWNQERALWSHECQVFVETMLWNYTVFEQKTDQASNAITCSVRVVLSLANRATAFRCTLRSVRKSSYTSTEQPHHRSIRIVSNQPGSTWFKKQTLYKNLTKISETRSMESTITWRKTFRLGLPHRHNDGAIPRRLHSRRRSTNLDHLGAKQPQRAAGILSVNAQRENWPVKRKYTKWPCA